MNQPPDIVIADKEGKVVAIVEVKSSRHMSGDIAAEYLKRYKDSGALEGVQFFVLVSRNGIYLWKRGQSPDWFDLSSQESGLPSSLAERAANSPDGYSMELAVLQWLYDFAANEEEHRDPAEQVLKNAGVLSAMQQGTIRLWNAT